MKILIDYLIPHEGGNPDYYDVMMTKEINIKNNTPLDEAVDIIQRWAGKKGYAIQGWRTSDKVKDETPALQFSTMEIPGLLGKIMVICPHGVRYDSSKERPQCLTCTEERRAHY